MADIGAISGLAAAVVAIGGLFGTSLRVNRQTTTVNNYRETALSWEAKARAQESELAELREQNAELLSRVGKQDGEISSLRDLVTGRQALLDIQADIRNAAEELAQMAIPRRDFDEWRNEVRAQLAEIREHLGGSGSRPA
jgi:septation ring formation regulator EzrA